MVGRRKPDDGHNAGVEHKITAGGAPMMTPDGVRMQRALTAAAMTIDLKDKKIVKRLKSFRQDWQAEAWSYYRTTPLVGFGADFVANAMSRLRFHVAWQEDVSDWPNEIDPDDAPEEMDERVYETATNILARLDSGQGLMEMARKCAYGLTLPGEVVVLGREEEDSITGTKAERFDAYSTSEIDLSKADRGEISVRTTPAGMGTASSDITSFKIDPATAWFFRVWRPDPEYSQLAATPMQRILEACEEQGLLRRYMRGSYRSRLNAGIFEVPQEWGLGPNSQFDDNGNPIDKLADDLVAALMTAVGDEASAATVVPYVIHAPAETLGKARHITFDRTFDDRAMEMRRRLDEEIASGLDLPDQVLLGLGDVKFRNAEVITKEQFKLHLEPLAIVLVKAWTLGFMLPMLIADGVDPEVARQYTIWYDAAAITSDPDQSESSKFGYDRGVLSARAWLNANNYTEEDMPDDDELAARAEGIPWPILKPLIPRQPKPGAPPEPEAPPGVDQLPEGQAPVPAPSGENSGKAPVPAPRAVPQAAGLVAAGGRPTRPLVRHLGRRMAIAEAMCRMKIQQLADASMRRGFERIGAATRTKARDAGPEMMGLLAGIDNRAIVTQLGYPAVTRLGVDPQRHLGAELNQLEGRFREAVQAHQYRMVSMLSDATGTSVETLIERSAASWAHATDHAWAEFEKSLNRLAHDKLFLALVAAGPEQRLVAANLPPVEGDARLMGEFDATISVPAGIVRDAMSIAGGMGNPTGGDPSTLQGVSGGPIMDDLLAESGVASEGFEWMYGDSATRARPFEPHEDLGTGGEDGGGVTFTSYDDPVLANPNDFPDGATYFPGDHAGCQCDVVNRLVDTSGDGIVEDPVSPSGLADRGFGEAPIGEAEFAKSATPGYGYPKGDYPVGTVAEPRPLRPRAPAEGKTTLGRLQDWQRFPGESAAGMSKDEYLHSVQIPRAEQLRGINWSSGMQTEVQQRAVTAYEAGAYEDLNAALRAENPFAALQAMDREDRLVMGGLDQAIQGSKTTDTTVVYRGVTNGKDFLSGLKKVGDGFTDRGYVSTSLSDTIAERFGMGARHGAAMLEIELPPGTPSFMMPPGGGLAEVVLPRGSSFELVERTSDTIRLRWVGVGVI